MSCENGGGAGCDHMNLVIYSVFLLANHIYTHMYMLYIYNFFYMKKWNKCDQLLSAIVT